MSNDLELYHTILFTGQPWLDKTTIDQKYQQLLNTVSKENYAQQPLYELNFPLPLTPKRKYYHAIIDNEARRYLNLMHNLVNNALDDKEKKYWVHLTLRRKLKSKFEETEKRIVSRQLYYSVIDDKQKDRSEKDNAYILHLLKYELIRLYLEIQNTFPAFLKEEPVTEEEIHSMFFSEEVPEKSFIIKAADYNLPKPTTEIVEQTKKKTFNAIKADIREPKKGVLMYEEIIAKPDRFALVEQKMFDEEILNQQYDFRKKKGNNEKVAALFRIMMQKSYFNKYSFSGGRKEITDLQIRHFLNHRYRTNIDREVRNFRNSKAFDKYLDNNVLIRQFIPS
jgi:hypothetical protein